MLPKRHEADIACPDWIYNNRHHVERHSVQFKKWRTIAKRYEKTAQSVMGVIYLAAVLDGLKQ